MKIKKLVLLLLLIGLSLSPSSFSAQLVRPHSDTITNGSVINANDLNDEFNSLLNGINSQDLRLNTQESLNKGVRASDPSSPANGEFWYNTTSQFFKGQINGSIRRLLDVNVGGIFNKYTELIILNC